MPGESTILRFLKATDKAFAPERGSKGAAGFDLKSAYDVIVPARGRVLCRTDLKVSVPNGCYGRIAPRSGLALKNGIDVGAGVVDEDYRGDVGVVLFNHSDSDFQIKKGERIAQFICEKICYPELLEVSDVSDLGTTGRGEGGFGSTGIN